MRTALPAFLLVSCVSLATTAGAQVQWGGKAGLNYLIASQTLEPTPKTEPATPKGMGFQFGGFAQFAFSDMIGLRPELLVSFRKVVSDDSQVNSNVTYQDGQGNQGTGTQTITIKSDTRLSYIQIPAPLCITPSENFRIMVGPAFSMLLGAKNVSDVTQNDKVTINGTNYDENTFSTTTTKGSAASKYYTGFEVSGMAGAGYKLDMGLDFDLRFYRAVVTTFDRTESNSRSRAWANMIEFSVGFVIGG